MTNKFAQQILEAYEKNVFYLPLNRAGHFFERAYKVSGNKKYSNIIAYHLKINKIEKIKKSLQLLKSGQYKIRASIKNPEGSERQKRRIALYNKNPQIDFFNTLLIDIHFCKMFGLDKTVLKNEFSEIINLLKKIDFRNLYLREDVIKYVSSYAFNSAFILRHFDVDNISDEMVKMLRKSYWGNGQTHMEKLPDYEYSSLIYSLTHIIIADSGYYERFVNGYDWIIDFFAENIKDIIPRVTLDIVSEIGLCIKLCRKEKTHEREYNSIKKYILSKYSINVFNNKDYIIKEEHTNSILMLLFWDIKSFKKGPDLSNHEIFCNK